MNKIFRKNDGNAAFSESSIRKAMSFAILSSCFGAVSQIMVRESSILILYAGKLGAGRFLSLFTTSAQLLAICLFIIPVSYLMEHTGKKKIVLPAVLLTLAGILTIASAGFFAVYGRIILFTGLLLFSVSLAVYVAGWFPLLKGIVPENHGGKFFGRLRLSWQSVVTVFLLLSYFFIGKDASVATLQIVIGISGFLILGRFLFVARIPEKRKAGSVPGFRTSLKEVLSTKDLLLFGGFIFLFFLFSDSTIPVAYVYAKSGLGAPDNYTVLLSFFVNIGSVIGFGLTGFFFHKTRIKTLMLYSGLVLAGLNISMLLIREYTPAASVFFILMLTIYAAFAAAVSVGATAKMLTLAGGNTINVSLAVSYAFQTAGKGLSRIGSGFLLGSAGFSRSWNVGSALFSEYHSFFLLLSGCLLLLVTASLAIYRLRTLLR